MADEDSTATPHWELEAREQIRHTIISYAIAGDRVRLADLAGQFTEDGVPKSAAATPRAGGTASSRCFPRTATPGNPPGKPFFVRHFITNILVTEITPEEAQAVAYFAVFTPDGPDHWGRYRGLARSGRRALAAAAPQRASGHSFAAGGWYQRVHGAGEPTI